jgi:hypothetical protein
MLIRDIRDSSVRRNERNIPKILEVFIVISGSKRTLLEVNNVNCHLHCYSDAMHLPDFHHCYCFYKFDARK